MKWLCKCLRIGYGDRTLIISTFVLLASVRLGLWLLRFRILLKISRKISQFNSNSKITQQFSVRKIAWCVDKVSCFMPGVKCLARALTTQMLMSRYGYNSQLRIGVAKGEQGNLEAHAWVEYQEKVVIGYLPDLYRFISMPSLDGIKL
jgi:Transglutaminase-like superfamily